MIGCYQWYTWHCLGWYTWYPMNWTKQEETPWDAHLKQYRRTMDSLNNLVSDITIPDLLFLKWKYRTATVTQLFAYNSGTDLYDQFGNDIIGCISADTLFRYGWEEKVSAMCGGFADTWIVLAQEDSFERALDIRYGTITIGDTAPYSSHTWNIAGYNQQDVCK